jgi:hypothetical protein
MAHIIIYRHWRAPLGLHLKWPAFSGPLPNFWRKIMGKSLALIALAGSLLVAAPALADAPKGARIEGLAGWDRVSLDEGDYGLGTYSKNGFGYGAQIGYANGRISASLPGYHAAANGDGVRLASGPSRR